ncbi:MAG: Valine--tRNA ligase [Microgenomates bacterium OLB23]|nr:MAG: Valine--tRNA ligase [Microgenomates bacterium OLB23]
MKHSKKLHDDGLVYRDNKLVNYCCKDGTSFSDLEVVDKEIAEDTPIDAEGGLFFINYQVVNGAQDDAITVATTRPETMFGDAAVMVHPSDERYQHLIGKTVRIPVIHKEIPVIADEYVDVAFGTGAVKVTPLHDFNDFEVAKRHSLTGTQVIGFDGKIMNTGTKYDGLRVIKARTELAKDLQLVVAQHKKVLKVCYKCGKTLEPLPKEQWFIKVRPLADKAKDAVEKGAITIYPKRFKQVMLDWLDRFHDWNISRQIVWGIRVPAYKCVTSGEWFVSVNTPAACEKCGACAFVQDEDTFDTWFSSSQWPFATLKAQHNPELFNYFYPTTVMETGYDILPAWVVRMSMIGLYATGKVPFTNVYLHGMVRDKKGLKMSKSKGNVVNPLAMVEKYGADALRATLVFQTTPGGDVNFAEDKIVGMRNFSNKLWNIGRLIKTYADNAATPAEKPSTEAQEILKELRNMHTELEKKVHKNMNTYQFARVFDDMYEFVWHQFADVYIERLKEPVRSGNIEVLEEMKKIFSVDLKLLHPFMPFVTEAVWKELYGEDTSVFDA